MDTRVATPVSSLAAGGATVGSLLCDYLALAITVKLVPRTGSNLAICPVLIYFVRKCSEVGQARTDNRPTSLSILTCSLATSDITPAFV